MQGFENLDDVRAAEDVPLDVPDTTYEILRRSAERHPDATALAFFLDAESYAEPRRWTYAEVLEKVHRVANLLRGLSDRHDETRVSVLLPNLPETFWTLFGGAAAGTVNPINPLLKANAIADILNAAGSRVLVTAASFPGLDVWEKVEAIADRVPNLETILRVDPARYLDEEKRREVEAGRRSPFPRGALRLRLLDFDDALAVVPGDRLDGDPPRGDDVATLFHTGGTTGVPKLARHTHAAQARNVAAVDLACPLRPDNVLFCGLPLFHVNGVFVTGLWPWSRGAAVVLGTPHGYRAPGLLPRFWKIVEHYRLTFFSGVPTIYSALLDVPVDADVSSLKYGFCGAAPMPVEVFQRFEEATGIRILEGYGMTEATCVCSLNPARGERRVGSVGLRLPHLEMKIALLDDDGAWVRDAADGEIGMLLLRGPYVFEGYLDPAHDRGAWVHLPGEGGGPWLVTGDLGRRDARGYFWLTGRAKELIIRGGHNIDPKTIEEPLHRHPDVALAAAVGRPDPHAGEVPVAYVQLNDDATATVDEIVDFARGAIHEKAALPKRIRIVDRLPLTAVGKIFKPALVRREVEQALCDALATVDGIAGVLVEALPDRAHGTLARVRIECRPGADAEQTAAAAHEVLGRFPVRYDLVLADRQVPA